MPCAVTEAIGQHGRQGLETERAFDRRADDDDAHRDEPAENHRDRQTEPYVAEFLPARQTRAEKQVVGDHGRADEAENEQARTRGNRRNECAPEQTDRWWPQPPRRHQKHDAHHGDEQAQQASKHGRAPHPQRDCRRETDDQGQRARGEAAPEGGAGGTAEDVARLVGRTAQHDRAEDERQHHDSGNPASVLQAQ